MSPKIERIWGSMFGQTAIRRKDSADKDGSAGHHQQQDRQQPEDERPKADRQSVEKAMSDLRSDENFGHTGMKVELINSPDGLKVSLVHANGTVVKTMTAEEFIRLRETSAGGPLMRGKILDQKF